MIPGVNERAFDDMNYAASDKTAVDLTGDKAKVTSEDVHNMLLAAGLTPGFGNIADVADAILYAAEGEFGAAGLSMAAIIPFIGQAVSAKRALKIAKESGEEMVTLYRGVSQWFPGQMVKNRKFVGGPKAHHTKMNLLFKDEPGALWTTKGKKYAEQYKHNVTGKNPNSILLEFEVPKSFIDESAKIGKIGQPSQYGYTDMMIFQKGLPVEFLKKVHK